ncbi:arf-GAP domain and FG repeat-containing protein 1 isoform X2 [Culicoides brevitarsis]|uniref:arf-GAP domain and FG repeat-containing protein 1 isoform X2 n=1 Tax=Culicoides brevitarsis TaxID=469753 RepID=UPI00307B6FDD
MALAQRKKQDDKILKLLREVANLPGNKHCFDCGEKGTTYVNSTIGSFVCTTCSGLLRGLTPPHRIKSISMATFTQEEIDFLKAHGNEECAKTWLGLWDAKRAIKQDHRDFMIDKYERKRYYLEPASPLMSIPSGRQLTNGSTSSSTTSSTTNGNQNPKSSDDLLQTINITPPSKLRQSSNATQNGSPIFKTVGPRAVNGHRLNNNGTTTTTTSNSSTGSDVTNSSANKFTPDTDFVADFSKIDMFSDITPNNGTNGSTNGSKSDSESSNVNGNMEFFADFEHNQIYNAAEDPAQFLSNINFFGNSSPSSFAKSETTATATTGQQQLLDNNNSIFDFNCNYNNNNNAVTPQQWNYWQTFSVPSCNNNNNNVISSCNNSTMMHSQQQTHPQNLSWTSFPNSCNNIAQSVSSPSPAPPTETNRWSLPMSVSSVSSLSSSNTFSSNTSTPSVDKYAALKDLDEQFKEIKILGTDTNTPINPQSSLANPFKNPSLQSALNATNNNSPASASPWSSFDNKLMNGTTTTNGGWPAATNGFAPQQFPNGFTNGFQSNANQSMFSNGFMATNNAKMGGFNANNAAFGFSQGSTFSNPFVAAQTGTVNSNNPFL